MNVKMDQMKENYLFLKFQILLLAVASAVEADVEIGAVEGEVWFSFTFLSKSFNFIYLDETCKRICYYRTWYWCKYGKTPQ